MEKENPFDRKLSMQRRLPDSVRDAATETTDTLDLCWASAQAVFGSKAKPEHALVLLPLFIEQAAEKRRQLRSGESD
jgi:hypothetical protein